MRVLRPALLLAGLVCAGLVLRQSGLGAWIKEAGAQGPGVYVLGGAALCAVGMPRQVVAYAGGLAFGASGGTVLALLAEVAGCAASYGWARAAARPTLERFLRRRAGGHLARVRERLLRQPFIATLTFRLLPVGNSLLLSVLAGAAALPFWPFLLASGAGFVPQTLVFVLLGDGVEVGGTMQVAIGVALFAVSVAGGMTLMRRQRVDSNASRS